MKLTEEYVREDLGDLGLGKNFLDIIPKPWFIKNLINYTTSKFETFLFQKQQQQHTIRK